MDYNDLEHVRLVGYFNLDYCSLCYFFRKYECIFQHEQKVQ